nr:uL15 family ribosomal protein [Candidatus Atribacteria bacterium]
KGIVKKVGYGIKILAEGELNKKLTIKANKFSQKAISKIESVSGKVEVV